MKVIQMESHRLRCIPNIQLHKQLSLWKTMGKIKPIKQVAQIIQIMAEIKIRKNLTV